MKQFSTNRLLRSKRRSENGSRYRPIIQLLERRDLPSGLAAAQSPIYLSGLTPWPDTSDLAGQTGTNYLNSAVEPSIAADPRNSQHLVGVWQQDRWSNGGSRGIMSAVSTDGGATWTDAAIPGVSIPTGGPLPRASDPWVSIAPNGDVYVSILSADSVAGPDETIYVSKSTDGGYTWGTPTAVISDTDPHFFDDKDTITADPTNSNDVYVTWDRLTADPITGAFINGPAMLSRSTDGGQTWTNSVIFAGGTSTQTVSNQIAVLPDGTLLDLFDFSDFNANTTTIEVARSTDHGATWSTPIAVAADLAYGLWDPNSTEGVRGGAGIPEIAVNRTTGTVYIAWEDARFSSALDQHDSIVISQSTDGGLTWSEPTQVNQTPTNIPVGSQQAFTPQVAVAANGVIAVTYYDFRNDTGGSGLATDYWVAFANPGPSLTFGNETRLTPSSFNGELAPNAFGYMLGDYEGLVAGGASFNTFASIFEMTDSTQNSSRMAFENISVNSPPSAVNDSATVQENSSNDALAVLANDSDPDGDTLTISGNTTPSHGMASVSSNVIYYTPQPGYFGADSFSYTISDGQGGTATATVFVTVNAPPVAVNDFYTVQQNSVNNSLAVLVNDTDPDGEAVSIASVGTPGHGSAILSGNNIVYTPTAGYYGTDSFTYTASDGQGGTSTATVSVNVTFRPVTITGTVFRDQNDNHIEDAGETGLAGWTVQLDGGAMTATTNASGAYIFTGVGPGAHTISEVVQSAYIETSPRGNAFVINTSNGVDVSGENFSNEVPTNARDNSLSGYSEHGGGWTTLNSGWRGSSRVHAADPSGKSYATWQMNAGASIAAGKYEIFVSYVPAAGRATNATYTIADNKTTLATLAIDQTLMPNDGLYQNVGWRSLGVFTFNSGKPVITLNAKANGSVDADGVLLIPAPAFAPPMSPQAAAGTTLAQINRFQKALAGPSSTETASRDMFFGLASQLRLLEGLWVGAMLPTVTHVDSWFAADRPQLDDAESMPLPWLLPADNIG